MGPWWVDRRPSRWSAVRRAKRRGGGKNRGEITVEEKESGKDGKRGKEKRTERQRTKENLTSCLGLFSHPWGTGPQRAKMERMRRKDRGREREQEDQSDVREDRRK